MFFCHLIDDFVLQNKFSYLKQKSWWVKTCKDNGYDIEKYKNDYKMALFEHSLEWSIAITIPIMFMTSINDVYFLPIIAINTIFHYIIDDRKANKLKLSLVQDQFLHFMQILLTFLFITAIIQ